MMNSRVHQRRETAHPRGESLAATLLCLVLLACLPGCRTRGPGSGDHRQALLSPLLAKAESLHRDGKHDAAMIECIDVAQSNHDLPGLPDLQHRIVEALTRERARLALLRAEQTHARMDADTDRLKAIPDTYGLRRSVRGETSPLRGIPTAMEKALSKNVTVHLISVNLNDFILAVGASENINIIADDFESDRTMTLHAEETPLSEILAYVSRNMGVTFSVGENIIWVTPMDTAESGIPMETRVYRLRKGIAVGTPQGPEEDVGLLEAVQRFVPAPPGSDILFDMNAHVLIVKNTRQNLARVEDIIASLDVVPQQVLIEARFISTTISDLAELGIDWVLNSPLAVTRNTVLRNGTPARVSQTQIDEGAAVGFSPFANEAQGLNLTYQGLLTDPMFQAVLHALDISGKSRTLSVPKVTTVNNHPALIRIGEDFRYFDEYDIQSVPSSVSGSGQTVYSSVVVPVGKPQLEELGIELQASPSVGADQRTITLNLIPEISEFVRYETYEVAAGSGSSNQNDPNTATNVTGTSLVKLPVFRRSRIETEVLVRSGETVVMGGLISSVQTRQDNNVPILSAIPIIGRLFRHFGTEETKQNLLIFVTATILSERGERLIPIVNGPESQ